MIDRKLTIVGIGLLAMGSPALAQTPQFSSDELALIRKLNANPEKKEAALRMLGKPGREASVALRQREAAASPAAQAATKVAVRKEPSILTKNTPQARAAAEGEIEKLRAAPPTGQPRQFSACAGWTFLLRQDWKDIGLLGCPETTDKAAGAELSYSDDRVARNGVFTARGTAAVYYTSMTDVPTTPNGPYYQAFGAYLTVNRAINSSAALSKSDSDKIAFGGALELGYETPFGANYFRLRGGVVEDRLKNTSAMNLTAEFIPEYDDFAIHLNSPFRPLGAPFYVSFDPSFLVQYAAVTGKGQLLDFNDLPHALRIGPQATLRVFPLFNAEGFMARLSGAATYHWAYETYSRRGISWFQTSVTYNIDDAGQLGITGSYKKGSDEDTGTRTDIYKIALTGKI